MRVVTARLVDFRNVTATVDLGPGINVFFGSNGQGKTNLLEAVFSACYGRSFRPGRLADLVRFGAEFGSVELDIEESGVTTPVRSVISGSQRRVSVGGREKCTVEEVGEVLRVVFFGPEDLNLVKGGPAARRDFLDLAITAHHPPYSLLVRGYAKLLKERNALLRDVAEGTSPPPELLDTYDVELARHGAQLLSWRRKYLAEFLPVARELVAVHTASDLRLTMEYQSSVVAQDGGIQTDSFFPVLLAALNEQRSAESAVGGTPVGPHRDDLELLVNGRPARYFASQGEQRQVAVSLKLAQLALWRRKFNLSPVLLLDDVLSELDPERARLLFTMVLEWGVQTLISTTTTPDMLNKDENMLFEVTGGKLEPRGKG